MSAWANTRTRDPVPNKPHDYLQSGNGRGGDGGWAFLYLAIIGSSFSFGQNFGEPISRKQDAFQYNPESDGSRPAFTACATASMSLDSG